MKKILHLGLVANHGEHWGARQQMDSKEHIETANARIENLQVVLPIERARRTLIDPEHAQVPRWDKSSRVDLTVAKQLYNLCMAAGKIRLESPD